MNLDKYRQPVPQSVLDHVSNITVEEIIKKCTPRGNGKSIKTGKPREGIYAYIWRWMRFHSGIDTTMPCTDIWDLSQGIEETCGVDIGISLLDSSRKELLDILEKKVDEALLRIPGANPLAGAARWGKALGYL